MNIKVFAKTLVGKIRAKYFQIQAGKDVYIGKHCALKGKQNIVLEDFVTVRPYVQIWSGGGRQELGQDPKSVKDAGFRLQIH